MFCLLLLITDMTGVYIVKLTIYYDHQSHQGVMVSYENGKPIWQVLTKARKEINITEQFDCIICRYGYLSPKQAQPVHREVATLCTELRPHALNLVDAFGIPKPFLGAIGFDWVEYNSWENVL